MEDFDLAPEPLTQGFDVSTPAPPAPAPPQDDSGRKRKLMMVLGPLIAAAMKRGGPMAAGALLQGVQQREMQRQQQMQQQGQQGIQNARLDRQEEMRAAQMDATQNNQMADRRNDLLKTFQGGMQGVDSPEAARALMGLYRPQAESLGMNADAMDGALMEYATPSRLQMKQAQAKLAEAQKTFGDRAAEMVYAMPGEDQPLTFEELQRRAGFQRNPAAAQTADPTKGASDFDRHLQRHYAAVKARLGRDLTPEELVSEELKARKAYQQIDDRPQPQATVLIQTVDDQGRTVQRMVPRVAGSEFATAPSASQQTAMAEQETSLVLLDDITSLYKPELVGPIVARATRARMQIPGAPDVPQEVAEFYAGVASLRNEIIKMMSGAAVSGSEEARMRSQLPDVTDKPSVFQAKLAQTRRNRETLLTLTAQRTGQPARVGGPGPGPKTTQKIGRFDVEVAP
jgi:hypothetical protein